MGKKGMDLDAIATLVEKHNLVSKSGSGKKNECWAAIAQDYNDEKGEEDAKTAKQLQNRWNDYQSKLKKKASDLKAHRNGTGGGPTPNELLLTEEEERHRSIGNSVNTTYQSEFDSENDFNLKKYCVPIWL